MINLSNIHNIIKYAPADDKEIDDIEKVIDGKLPRAYREILKCTNGFSVGGGLLIYGTGNIVERNMTWEVEEYAKGYVAIGDDGGGNVLLMLKDVDTKELLVVDSGDMNPDNFTRKTTDLIRWISDGCSKP